jgi:hypothetical protein
MGSDDGETWFGKSLARCASTSGNPSLFFSCFSCRPSIVPLLLSFHFCSICTCRYTILDLSTPYHHHCSSRIPSYINCTVANTLEPLLNHSNPVHASQSCRRIPAQPPPKCFSRPPSARARRPNSAHNDPNSSHSARTNPLHSPNSNSQHRKPRLRSSPLAGRSTPCSAPYRSHHPLTYSAAHQHQSANCAIPSNSLSHRKSRRHHLAARTNGGAARQTAMTKTRKTQDSAHPSDNDESRFTCRWG